jgi:pimeloyl-ACP methyl ester carboxylesterase
MVTQTQMNPTPVAILKVPGATLYYEVRGSGPVLLMIPGGPTDAGVYVDIAGVLAGRYTVVTYDPRGNSRSALDGPPEDWRAELHADDARRLLSAVADGPAYVFGNSGGALVGLALAAGHPESVRVLVAHEPPAMELLPDREARRAAVQDVYDTYRREGVGPAMVKFLAAAGLDGPPPPPPGGMTPERAEGMARMGRNVDRFLAHGLRAISGYVPDVSALRAASTRVVVAGGQESRRLPAYEASAALAARLETTVVEFPGGHGGFGSHPAEFAEVLHRILGAR